MIVGWRVAGHMRTTMGLDALEMARRSRGAMLAGLRCHSDAGSQFTSVRYGERLAEIGAPPSIGTVGDSFEVSRRRGSHPPPLLEPCVTVSRHTAPVVEPVGNAPCRQWANMPG
jgi:transposase InsO family protein